MPAARMTYTVRFLCPAFLGNAEQSGQWRTPPFKALLRQWWRIAYAADYKFEVDVNAMRQAEGRVFGAAADSGSSTKSQLRLRLDCWEPGRMRTWQALPPVQHPEVNHTIGSDLYLGYGPLTPQGGRTALKTGKTAIQAGECAILHIALGANGSEGLRIATAIRLLNLYGTVGGRSRNGWGSFVLQPLNDTPAIPSTLEASVVRPWGDALKLDWPHAIGKDENNPLIWQTRTAGDWKEVMKELADLKIALRTQFRFPDRRPPHPAPLPRHWLSYPITKHGTDSWDRNARLPNSLRFKLRCAPGDRTKVHGVVFHVPCRPPPSFKPDLYRNQIQETWQKVHGLLDQRLSRIPA